MTGGCRPRMPASRILPAEDSLDAAFPILISPSGEEMYFQRARTGEGVPFLSDGQDSIGLTLSYG